MATTDACVTVTRIAGEALTIYRCVKTGASGRVTHTDVVANGPVDGIVMEDGINSGDNVPVAIPNGAICKVEAGGALAVGDEVTTNGSGQVTAAAVGNTIIGTYLGTGAAASGDVVEIQFAHKGVA